MTQQTIQREGVFLTSNTPLFPSVSKSLCSRLYHLYPDDNGWGTVDGNKWGYGVIKGSNLPKPVSLAEDNNVSEHCPPHVDIVRLVSACALQEVTLRTAAQFP